MSKDEYREWGQQVADEIMEAADNGAGVGELLDILDSSGYDGDILDFF